MIKVSAILPVYNAEKTLERAVNSLLIQPEIDEIFLIEDGSEDGSFALCQKLEAEFPTIKLHTHPNHENRGAPASRNLGLSLAKNDWLQFMDADDELLSGKIADQVKLIENNESLIVSPFLMLDDESESLFIPMEDFWSGLIATRLGNTVSNLFNRKIAIQAGGWNESLKNVQEYHLMFEMLKLNPIFKMTEACLSHIYPQPESITNSESNFDEKRDNYFIFRDMVRNYLLEVGEYNLKRKHYYNICTGENLKYHSPSFEVVWNPMYYSFYKLFKRLKPA
ncbi:glycosyltransferase family 2 protein [Algoriphagus namhaensis]|uniref:Glycosyltransferase family 2 protein n=1 Tax=Algoriphagus namhaensis TaxID=915353 RepID=A0ABV8ASL3_9BACT